MTEEQDATLGEVQKAAAAIVTEVESAHEHKAISDTLAVGMQLMLRMNMLKKAHRPGADFIVQTYCEQVGIDYMGLEEQISARIYEKVQLARIEKGLAE